MQLQAVLSLLHTAHIFHLKLSLAQLLQYPDIKFYIQSEAVSPHLHFRILAVFPDIVLCCSYKGRECLKTYANKVVSVTVKGNVF